MGTSAIVNLFIDRVPLYTWTRQTAAGQQRLVAICLPLHISEKGGRPPPVRTPQRWAIDTRFTAEAFAWRSHLLEAGLNPNERLYGVHRVLLQSEMVRTSRISTVVQTTCPLALPAAQPLRNR